MKQEKDGMSGYKYEYWLESLECALDAAGAFDQLTKEQREHIARSLSVSAENEGTAFGRDDIPNPLHGEIKRLTASHAQEIKSLKAEIATFRNSIARRRGVEPSRIYTDRGDVLIAPN